MDDGCGHCRDADMCGDVRALLGLIHGDRVECIELGGDHTE